MKHKTIAFVGEHFQKKAKLDPLHGGLHPAYVKSEKPWARDKQYQFLSGVLTGIGGSLVIIVFVCLVVFFCLSK